ncbi:MAG: hypothetical protein JSV36_11100 [Anaerolineae bacterium]|nr:MAG: hypothetical protein JSV36_11100 [Anaerolineae bacterium]
MTKHLHGFIFVGLLLLLASLAAGCAQGDPIAPVPPTPTVADPITPKRPDIAPTPTPATRHFPLPAPTLIPVAARPSSQNCIACHTDVEALKAMATVVEKTESKSEGEG